MAGAVLSASPLGAAVEQTIREALAEDRVEVCYQPIYAVRSDSFPAAEALCRLRLRDGGLLSPAQFIPAAEATGLIAALGERVFARVCRFLQRAGAEAPEQIGVNLSPIQCGDPTLAARYGALAARYGIEPRRIPLEITETAADCGKAAFLEQLRALREQGFDLVLDDFGSGASDLLRLAETPVRYLKVDRSLTRRYFTEPEARDTVAALMAIGRERRLGVVFEGVETAEQAAGVAAVGADYLQGYYYAAPLSEGDFSEFLSRPKQNRHF